MREQLEQRLASLQEQLTLGERMLAELDAKRQDLQATMLRIGGAAQVLTELLGAEDGTEMILQAVPAEPPAKQAVALTAT